jgi:MFS family permease
LKTNLNYYPRQFWLLIGGYFVNQASASLIWPFLTVFMRERLNESLTTITLLFSVQAVAGLVSTSIVGSLMDRFGRKQIMIVGLLVNAGVLLAMSQAYSLPQWVILSALYGAFVTIFGVGSNAMVADLIEPERRVNAYALLRMGSNLGLALGPAVGGFMIVHSPVMSYGVTAAANLILAGLVAVFLAESLSNDKSDVHKQDAGSYRTLLRDRLFLEVFGLCILVAVGATLVFRLMPVYIKENFGIAEDQFGLIVTVNAAMVVLLQYGFTRISSRFRPLPVLTLGALVYTIGVGSVAWGSTFPAFVLSMVIVTCGELLVAPTSTALVANLAPPNMRARYMGMFSINYMIAGGTGPVMGGYLADKIGPAAIWYGGMLIALIAVLGFALMARAHSRQRVPLVPVLQEP